MSIFDRDEPTRVSFGPSRSTHRTDILGAPPERVPCRPWNPYTALSRFRDRAREVGVLLGDVEAAWKGLTDDERAPWLEKAKKDHEAYIERLEQWEKDFPVAAADYKMMTEAARR